jgi:hypothetical protein
VSPPCNELLLQSRQHQLSLAQIGDVSEIARAGNLHDVDPLLLTGRKNLTRLPK